jgi:general secretion pathway protein G
MMNWELERRNTEAQMQIGMMNRKSEKGFSLIELIVVMVILTMLVAIVGPRLFKYVSSSKPKAAAIQIRELEGVLDLYALDVGNYPDTSQGLDSLIRNPGIDAWNGPYLKKDQVPKDPWGRPYVYRCPGMHAEFDLFSVGPDGVDGGDDDIVSWK